MRTDILLQQIKSRHIVNNKIVFVISLAFLTGFSSCNCGDKQTDTQESTITVNSSIWDTAKEIEQSVVLPIFPDKIFNVLDYGVREGEAINNAEFFKKAIDACNKAGGGKVVVPEGTYYTGAIHLEDNVNFHLEEGAEIRFSTDPKDYLPVVHTSFEGTELMNYSPLVYAFGKKNIALTGKGILNGQADNENWWSWKRSKNYG